METLTLQFTVMDFLLKAPFQTFPTQGKVTTFLREQQEVLLLIVANCVNFLLALTSLAAISSEVNGSDSNKIYVAKL